MSTGRYRLLLKCLIGLGFALYSVAVGLGYEIKSRPAHEPQTKTLKIVARSTFGVGVVLLFGSGIVLSRFDRKNRLSIHRDNQTQTKAKSGGSPDG